jgi:two-component system heavy metal sensor histidine kinase CusS
MRWLPELGAWRRVDARLALFATGGTLALLAGLVTGFSIFAVRESLEEDARVLHEARVTLERELARGVTADRLVPPLPPVALRIRGGLDGPTPTDWPSGEAWREPTLAAALRARSVDYLLDVSRAPSGGTLEVALPLRRFARERAELFRLATTVGLLGALGAGLFGVVAARRALDPVRAMTRRMRAIDSRSLGERLPTRGTRDDVDELARSINQVLERLEWAFARLSGFSSDVSHELRTLVNRVLNDSEVALLEEGDSPSAAALGRVRATAEEMRDLVDQLLLLASGEEGRLARVSEPIRLDILCAAMVEFYAPLAESLGKKLELASVPVETVGDRPLIERALANLLENALRHSAEGACVRVEIGGGPDSVSIGVLDSGPGIPPVERERIFERFVRLDPARHGRGSGLGLPLARMIAHVHGGSLRASDSPLGGAAFWLQLPTGNRAALDARSLRAGTDEGTCG